MSKIQKSHRFWHHCIVLVFWLLLEVEVFVCSKESNSEDDLLLLILLAFTEEAAWFCDWFDRVLFGVELDVFPHIIFFWWQDECRVFVCKCVVCYFVPVLFLQWSILIYFFGLIIFFMWTLEDDLTFVLLCLFVRVREMC